MVSDTTSPHKKRAINAVKRKLEVELNDETPTSTNKKLCASDTRESAQACIHHGRIDPATCDFLHENIRHHKTHP